MREIARGRSAIDTPEDLPDERPQRRREYSGAGSTLGIAVLLIVVVGVGIWWFELRGDDSSGDTSASLGIVDLPGALNSTGRPAAAEVGRAAPNFRLATIAGGNPATLTDYRGRWVLVNFWASWCSPCRGETPDLQRLYEDAGPDGLVVLGVNQQESPATATEFVQQFGVSYPVLLDRDGGVNVAYRVGRGLPLSVLIDPAGLVRQIFYGRLSDDALATVAGCVRRAASCAQGAG